MITLSMSSFMEKWRRRRQMASENLRRENKPLEPHEPAHLAPFFAAEMRAELKRLKRDTETGRQGEARRPEAGSSGVGGRAKSTMETAQISGSSVVVEAAKRHKLWTVAGAAAVLALLASSGYTLYSLLRGKQHVPFETFTITQITDNGKSVRAAISPDSKYLLVVVEDKGKHSLWLHNIPSNSDTQVIDFLVARYGEFVLLKPRFNLHTLLLWLLPPLALAGGGLALWTYSRRRSKFPDTEDQALLKLTPEEEARLERLIAEQASPEVPPPLPPIASGPVSAKTFSQS